jgi:hypothetical protein
VSRDVHLDFRREQRPPVWPGALLLVVALAVATVLGMQYQRIADDVSSAEARVRVSSAGMHVKPVPRVHPADAQAVSLELKRATEIAAQLRLPWTGLFRSIESSPVPDVALLSIESDNEKRNVKIAAEGKNVDAMLAYLKFLESLPTLRSVYLESHKVQEQDPQRPVRFVVAADWVIRDAAMSAGGL